MFLASHSTGSVKFQVFLGDAYGDVPLESYTFRPVVKGSHPFLCFALLFPRHMAFVSLGSLFGSMKGH